jgi:hypothetical protein
MLTAVLQAAMGSDNCKILSMQALNVSNIQNNDTLNSAKYARMGLVQENSDTGAVNEENFKLLTGGDAITIKGMYQKAEEVDTPLKLTFFNNDQPIFRSQFALYRRIKNLPLRMQFLDPKGDTERKDELRMQGKGHYIADRDPLLKDKLLDKCIPAVLRWLVQGAVLYYTMDGEMVFPATIEEYTTRKHTKELFEDFCKDSLVYSAASPGEQHKNSLVFDEVFEVYCQFHNLKDMEDMNKNSLSQLFRKITEYDEFRGVVKKNPLYNYPSREGLKNLIGYTNITWKQGIPKLAREVNKLRRECYKNDTRPLLVEIEEA